MPTAPSTSSPHHYQVFYFYEPCRTLDWGDDPAGPAAASARVACEALAVRLLSCNASETDLKMLLKVGGTQSASRSRTQRCKDLGARGFVQRVS
jgi:hypothetical protein